MVEGRQLSFINRLRLSIREEQSCQLQVVCLSLLLVTLWLLLDPGLHQACWRHCVPISLACFFVRALLPVYQHYTCQY